MKKNKNNKAQKLEKTDLVEGINNLIEEKACLLYTSDAADEL